jgi:hypothetical protein
MAAITFTAADVRPLAGAKIRRFDAGGTVGMGKPVYIAADGDVELCKGDLVATTLGTIGLAVATPDGGTSASANERVDVAVYGPVAGFTSLTPGSLVWLSDTTTGGMDTTENTAGLVVGVAESATVVFVRPHIKDFAD